MWPSVNQSDDSNPRMGCIIHPILGFESQNGVYNTKYVIETLACIVETPYNVASIIKVGSSLGIGVVYFYM